ncbi:MULTISPECIES: hypothetical protein [unclassified Variovorax]|uniref:hypothetical protein n=1 Tax=unclassified Variovorax TaxID=663243 RepID=UPI003F45202A
MAEAVTRREFARLEGCDEKQVRRALLRGLLVADSEGKLDPAQVASGWRKPRADSKEAPAKAAPAARAKKAADTGADTAKPPKNVRTAPEPEAVDGVPVVQSAEGASLKRAVAHKEDFAGRLKELEYRQRAGEVISLELAKQVLFDEFRSARDAWLNWPTRYAAVIAAELGIEEADRLAETLTTYVHKQLASLGEPSGQFRKG